MTMPPPAVPGMPLSEVYGMSECTGPATLSLPNKYVTGLVGRKMPGTELKIAEDGEILVRGPNVFAGYRNAPELSVKAFDDEGARRGWCLYELGCKGPVTYNACASLKWNGGTSFPIQSGHGCIGCSEPGFWDMGPLYKPLSMPIAPVQMMVGAAAAGGAIAGAAMAMRNRAAAGLSMAGM